MYQSNLNVYSRNIKDLNKIQSKIESIAEELRSQGYIVITSIYKDD